MAGRNSTIGSKVFFQKNVNVCRANMTKSEESHRRNFHERKKLDSQLFFGKLEKRVRRRTASSEWRALGAAGRGITTNDGQ